LKFILIVSVFLATVYGKDLEKCPDNDKNEGKCVHIPRNCEKDCKAKATVGKKDGTDNYIFNYERADIGDTGFVAVGISNDINMGDDLAVACVKSADGVSRLHTLKTGRGSATLIGPGSHPLLLPAGSGSEKDGNLRCFFEIKFPFKFVDLEFKADADTYMLMSFGAVTAEDPYVTNHHPNQIVGANPFIKGTGTGGGGGGGTGGGGGGGTGGGGGGGTGGGGGGGSGGGGGGGSGDVNSSSEAPTSAPTPAPGDMSTASTERVSFQQIWTSGAFMWIGIGMFVIPFIFLWT